MILAQDLCRVCAVPSGQVQQALDEIGSPDAKVLSLDPHSLDDVIDGIGSRRRGSPPRGLGRRAHGHAAPARRGVRRAALRLPTVRVFALEWSDPPFARALGPRHGRDRRWTNLLNGRASPRARSPGARSATRTRGRRVHALRVLPGGGRGGGRPAARERRLRRHAGRDAGDVFAVDATSYFSRPGPGSSTAWRSSRGPIHPDAYPEPPRGGSPASGAERAGGRGASDILRRMQDEPGDARGPRQARLRSSSSCPTASSARRRAPRTWDPAAETFFVRRKDGRRRAGARPWSRLRQGRPSD